MSLEKLRDDGRRLAELLARSDFNAVAEQAGSLAAAARACAETLRKACCASHPDLAAFLEQRHESPEEPLPAEPLPLLPGATQEAVAARWREQAIANIDAIEGIYRGGREIIGEWLYWGDLESREPALDFFKAEQIRSCAREARKFALLVSAPRRAVELVPGGELLRDDFRDASHWRLYGKGRINAEGGRLHATGDGSSVFCQKDLVDGFYIAFDFEPHSAQNGKAGALFAFPATPKAGNDYEISSGPMSRYNFGIDTYHVSLYRAGSGRTNLRRAGPGLKMLSTVQPDPCATLGRTYRIEIAKLGQHIQVAVDGVLQHAYVDTGTYGPCLGRGRFGIRHFAGGAMECFYSNFRIAALQ